MDIQINQGEGITHGIKRKLQESGTDTSKINSSIWGQIMTAVSEQKPQPYTGGSIFKSNGEEGAKESYQKNFIVQKGIIKIADDIWNKIVSLVTGKSQQTAPKVTTDPQVTEAPQGTEDPQVTDPQETEAPQGTEAPQVTDPQVTDPQVTDPQETEAPQGTEAPQETAADKLYDLNPYAGKVIGKLDARNFSPKSNGVKQNEDGTFTQTVSVIRPSNGKFKEETLEFKYDANGNVLVKEDINDTLIEAYGTWIKETSNYNETTHELSSKEYLISVDRLGRGSNTTLIQKLLNQSIGGENNTFKDRTFKDKDGDVIVTVKDGKCYNSKNKEIPLHKAYELLAKSIDKETLNKLVDTY